MEQCIFCKIANHKIPGKIIYEDEQCMAFLDLSQTTDGHTLIIPKDHFDHILDADPQVLSHMMKVSQSVMKTLQKALDVKGFNVVSNMNEVAGQTVQHFHIHIIPRYNSHDTFDIKYTDNSKETDLEAIYEKIKASL